MILIPLWALVIFYFDLCLRRGRWFDWLILGFIGALTILAKYVSFFLLICVPLWLFLHPQARLQLRHFGPWLALAVFLLTLSPHLLFLWEISFEPFYYSIDRASQGHSAFYFLAVQILNQSVLIAIIIAFGLWRFLPSRDLSGRASSGQDHFLLFFAFLPLTLFVLILSLADIDFRSMWGAPFFTLLGLLVMRFGASNLRKQDLSRLFYMIWALLISAPLIYGAIVSTRPFYSSKPSQIHYPQKALAREVSRFFTQEAGKPPQILVGTIDIAGRAALGLKPRPQVMING